MFLRFQDIGRIGIVSSFALLACTSSTPDDTGGSGGAGASTGGMATAGSSGSSGSSPGGAGASSGGAGASTGGAGAATGGSGGTTAGAGGSGGASAGSGGAGGSGGAKSKTTFFVTSDTSMTGKLGGLEGADTRCQSLATKAGFGDHTFHAYLSTATVNAKDRIGAGPWVNAKGLTVAASVAALHSTTKGDHTLFIDEKGVDINGQWNSDAVPPPPANEHDVLTGTKADGTVQTGLTCMDWTSDSADLKAQVGHSDGMGPGKATTGTYSSWNSAHDNGSCMDTKPKGGIGRIYCFAID